MKNIIYSIYIENNESNLNEKHLYTKQQLKKHLDRLIDVKKEYAKNCNAVLYYLKMILIMIDLKRNMKDLNLT